MVTQKFINIGNIYNLFLKLEERRSASEDIIDIAPQEEISNNDNSSSVAQYIVKKTPSFKKTIKSVLNLMNEYEFESTPSVDKNYNIYLKNHFTNYDLLYEIDLFSHTTNVAYEILKLNKQGNTAGINVLNALFHDFGKSPHIKKFVPGSAKMPHEKISAKFAEEYLQREAFNGNREITKEVINSIVKTINMQHSPVKVKDDFLRDLIIADKNARTQEIAYVQKYLKIESNKKVSL